MAKTKAASKKRAAKTTAPEAKEATPKKAAKTKPAKKKTAGRAAKRSPASPGLLGQLANTVGRALKGAVAAITPRAASKPGKPASSPAKK